MEKKSTTRNKERDMTRKVALSGVLAALVFCGTQIRISTGLGYINLGDGVAIFCGVVLGPIGGISAGIGSALSDLLAGYPQFILPTFLIRGAMGLISGSLIRQSSGVLRRTLVFLLCECIMLIGYFGFEIFYYNWSGACASLLMNAIQAAVGIVLALILYDAMRNLPISHEEEPRS